MKKINWKKLIYAVITTVIAGIFGPPAAEYWTEDDQPQQEIFSAIPGVQYDKWVVFCTYDKQRTTIQQTSLTDRDYLDNQIVTIKVQSQGVPSVEHCLKTFRRQFQDSSFVATDVQVQAIQVDFDYLK